MCPFFGLKFLEIDWFWSSFDLLEDVLSGITVPNNIIFCFFFIHKKSKKFFSLIFCNFYSLWKNANLEKKKNYIKIYIYHCILPCKFNHLWSSPSGPTWPYSTERFLSGPFIKYEAVSRSNPRLRSCISSKMWRFVP